MIIIRFCLLIVNQSKDRFFVLHVLLSMSDHYIKILLTINIIVQKLNIDDAVGVLRWVRPLFKFIYNYFCDVSLFIFLMF